MAEMIAGSDISIEFTTDVSINTPSDVKFVLQLGDDVQFQKAVGSGVSVISTTRFDVRLNKADTINLMPDVYRMQGLVITAGGDELPAKLDDGFLTILKQLAFS